jgi:hypothetical protein
MQVQRALGALREVAQLALEQRLLAQIRRA